MQDLRAELTENLGAAAWESLKPLLNYQSVVVVMNELDLLDVGEAIALDNTQLVSRWLNEKMIYKPIEEQLISWNETPEKQFNALIVQPFVLVQELA